MLTIPGNLPSGKGADANASAIPGESTPSPIPGDLPSERTGPLAQVLLLLLGVIAVGLAMVSFLRPRRREEEEEDKDEEGDFPDPSQGIAAAAPVFEPANDTECLLYEYQLLQRDLAHVRRHRFLHETPVEHGDRFGGRSGKLDASFEQLHELLYSVLYGARKVSPQDVSFTRKLCRRIRALLG